MTRITIFAAFFVISLSLFAISFPEGTVGLALVLALTSVAVICFRYFTDEKDFITSVYLIALAARMAFGVFIQLFDLQPFFGGDYIVYHEFGNSVANIWSGQGDLVDQEIYKQIPLSPAGWGMTYFVASIYYLVGENIFASQSVCAIIGAATAPMVYFCCQNIFQNKQTSKFAAMSVAIFPSFVIWSGQLLKDGLIVFLLVVAMTMVLELQKKLNYAAIVALILSMFGIFALRFYIFYVVAVAVVGSFLLGYSGSNKALLRNAAILTAIVLGLAFLGIGDRASRELAMFGSLERVQMSRLDLARSADTGFGRELDVSTTTGALLTLPVGFTYLILAPFPWQATNIRQAITIPDVLVWWALIPFAVSGLIYTFKNKLRPAIPILIFTVLLTVAYSITQGNVGTAYRQRTQIQVFLFIMVAVGWTLYKERKENRMLLKAAADRRVAAHLRGH